jgi:23S rRNA pseudouridine1911/1915/1917 synthase
MKLKYIVRKDDEHKDVGFILKKRLRLSTRLIRKLKKYHFIFLNHEPVTTNTRVQVLDKIHINLQFDESSDGVIPQKGTLDILFEDDWLIALNKPPKTIVHPTSNHKDHTLSNYLRHYYLSQSFQIKIRPVHRLDRDTSGVVLFAKNEYIQDMLTKQTQEKLFYKEYLAILHNKLQPLSSCIVQRISREKDSIIKRCVSNEGAPSTTHYQTLKHNDSFSVVKLWLETGRTHQIRVHVAYMNAPIVGDTLYHSSPSNNIDRQALHARKVSFWHPVDHRQVDIVAPIPQDMATLMRTI